MDLENEITQLIRNNIRPYHSSLTEEQNSQLQKIIPHNLNYEQLQSDLRQHLDLWKHKASINVQKEIGDLRKVYLGNLESFNYRTLREDLLRLPSFQLVNNNDETDNDALKNYNRLRETILSKCQAIDKFEQENAHEPEFQVIQSIFSSIDLPSWSQEVSLELKQLIQTLETMVKSWPTLSDAQQQALRQSVSQLQEWLSETIPKS